MLKLVGFALVALLLVSGQVLAAVPQSSDASLGRLRSAVGQIVILVDGTGTKERVRLEDVALLGAAAGSAAGAVIDFSHGREAIYETRVAAATAVSARPVLVRRGAGLMLQLAW